MPAIKIGTCGYQYYDPGPDWKREYESKLQAYSAAFPVGELNRTFYTLPQVSTAERWRREAVDDFEFTVKAWQAITHPWASPTWNGHRDDIPDDHTDEVGYLQPTPTVREAWERTRERACALDASVLLLQTPPSFDCTSAHERNMRQLLGTVDRDGLTIAWEPRGNWPAHPTRIQGLCEDLDLVHVVDILRAKPVIERSVLYTRLHGLNDDPYDYDYAYSDTELETLADTLRGAAQRTDHVYCLFNNFEMYANATALLDQVSESVQ